jgi:fibronectin-binding autotransporter adhesin
VTSSYQAAKGWYLDAVVQETRYFSEVRTSERGKTGDPKGWGGGVSLEGGYPFEVSKKLIVEPQAQLAYQRVTFDKFKDVDRIAVDLESGDSLRGRLGVRAQKTLDVKEQKWSLFLELNVIHEFLGEGKIKAGGVGFGADTGGTSLQFGGGLDTRLGPNAAVFMGVTYEKGVTSKTANSVGGTVGVRVNF